MTPRTLITVLKTALTGPYREENQSISRIIIHFLYDPF
jgi:hypothetical protein